MQVTDRKRWWMLCCIYMALLSAFFILLASCSPTVARQEVVQRQASWSASGQDSGITGETKVGFMVNADWIAGYDSLLSKFGDKLSPPRKTGDRNGITKQGDLYLISDAVLERHLVMNQRRLNESGP